MIQIEEAKALFKYDEVSGKLYRAKGRNNPLPWNEVKTSSGDGRYIVTTVAGKGYYAHRIVWLLSTGSWPPDCIDPIDGNGKNNLLANLRSVGKWENNKNKSGHSNNTSGSTGVCWNKASGKWSASVSVGGSKLLHLGMFSSKEVAVEARAVKLRELGYHVNHDRKLPEDLK